MRRTFLLLSSLLLLSACGGGTAETCARGFWDGEIGTCVPEGWQVLDRSQLDQKGMPPEVAVAFQSEMPVSGQFITVTVTTETMTSNLTPQEYSDASIQSVQGLPNYDEVDRRAVTIDGQEDLEIHVFTAQPSSDQPEARFYQLSTVADEVGYTFTAATPVTVPSEIEAQIFSMFETATFVEPEEGTE